MRRWLIVLAVLTMLSWRAQAHEQAVVTNGVYLPLLVRATLPPTNTPTSTPTRTPSGPTATSTRTPTPTRDPNQCAAEYPTVCIPPPPPDLNCTDIPFRQFTVLQPDRHHFDTDFDGIGCETL